MFALAGGAVALMGVGVFSTRRPDEMFGLLGKIIALHGKREALARVLIDGVGGMSGCLSYIVAYDLQDEDALWVTEVWENKESHEASLSVPSVQDAVSKGRSLIWTFGERFETTPVVGMVSARLRKAIRKDGPGGTAVPMFTPR